MRALHTMIATAALLAVFGCGPHAAEKAGAKADKAIADVTDNKIDEHRDALKDAGEKVDDATAKVNAETKKAGAEAKENLKKAGDDLKDATAKHSN